VTAPVLWASCYRGVVAEVIARYTHVPADTHARVRAALNAPAACSPPAAVRAAGDDR